jgi:AraC-like DNA-binding protein
MSRALSVYHGRFGRATLYELDRPMTLHAHREGHLIFFLGGSRGQVQVGEHGVEATPTLAAAINPWESHGFTPLSATSAGLFLVLYISPQWFCGVGPDQARRLLFAGPQVQLTLEIERLVGELTELLLTQRTVPSFERQLFELTELCRARTWVASVPQRRQPMLPVYTDFRIRKCVRLLTERCASEPDLDGVARESGLSRPHFYKLFKEQVGVTPSLYLNTLRMERAVRLVAAAEHSITEISNRLGFSCQSVFSRFFTSHVGMPPSNYRRVARVLTA